MSKNFRLAAAGIAFLFFVSGCTGAPPGVIPVRDFDVNRYMGEWYEVARLDHSFERGLDNVTATYALQEDGSVSVLNKGYDRKKCEWDEATGRAIFQGDPSVASLTVKFFGPFGGGYHVFALDQEEYSYALVAGPSTDYLWILSRTQTLPSAVRAELLTKAKDAGFDVDALIFDSHDEPGC